MERGEVGTTIFLIIFPTPLLSTSLRATPLSMWRGVGGEDFYLNFMANINQFIPFVLKWEGGYVNDPNDLGSPANRGVTLKTWQDCGYDKNEDGIIDEEDLKQIFVQDVIHNN